MFSKPLTCNKKIIFDGETFELSCEVIDSSIEAEWRKNGQVLQTSDRLNIKEDGMKHTLQISNAKPIDSGEYSICFNNISRKITVNVIGIIDLFKFDYKIYHNQTNSNKQKVPLVLSSLVRLMIFFSCDIVYSTILF